MADEKNRPQASPATPKPQEAAKPDPRDERIAALEATLARIESQLAAGAVNAVDAVQDRKSRDEQKALVAEIDKGTARRTQEACDREFPEGRFRFRCNLPDGNGHPELVVAAENEVDARARYLSVCGVRSAEKDVLVGRA